jgi:signal peptidase I
MKPTIGYGERCLADFRAYKERSPLCGDIVVVHLPPPDNRRLVERVIAIENETIEIQEGSVYVDGLLLKEPYLAAPGRTTVPVLGVARALVPKGAFFVMGDNRWSSEDSRQWGPIPISSVEGRVTAISFSEDPSRIGRSLE